MARCENTRDIVVFGKNQTEQTALLFRPRCKQWSCDYCAELNKDYWIQQAFRGATIIQAQGREIQFVTLTSRGYATKASSIYFFRQNWPKLNRQLKYHTNKWLKAFGWQWAYFLVPEHHKSGVAHFHLLAATHFKHKQTWKEFAYNAGFGFILDVQTMDDAGAVSGYVAKYLHKGVGAEQWPKGFMRVRHSATWPIVPDAPLAGWDWATYRDENTVWIEKNALLNLGWTVKDTRD